MDNISLEQGSNAKMNVTFTDIGIDDRILLNCHVAKKKMLIV